MLNSWYIAFLVSSVLGVLAGLGVGGGSLLVLWLTMALDMSHPDARVYNLLFFIPSAVIASFYRWRSGKLNLKKILPGILAGCLAAAGASIFGQKLDTTLLKKLFGILLLATAIRELKYKPKTAKEKEG